MINFQNIVRQIVSSLSDISKKIEFSETIILNIARGTADAEIDSVTWIEFINNWHHLH